MKLVNQILAAFLVMLAVLFGVSAISYKSIESLVETGDWVRHTHEVIGEAHLLQKHLVDMETGKRGYLISGKLNFLEPYENGNLDFDTDIELLKELVSDNPPQVARLEAIDALKEQWLKRAGHPEINTRVKMNLGEATMEDVAALIDAETGKSIMDNLRKRIAEFIHQEELLLISRDKESAEAVSNATTTIVIGLLVGLVAALLAVSYIRYVMHKQVGGDPAVIANITQRVTDGDLSIAFEGELDVDQGILGSVKRMVRSLNDTAERADAISTGDYRTDFIPKGSEDKLGISLQRMVGTFRELARIAERIARGDTSIEIKEQGEHDQLAHAMRQMVDTLNQAAQQADAVSSGQYDETYEPVGERDRLGHALQKMSKIIRDNAEQDRLRRWQSEGLDEVNALIRRSSSRAARESSAETDELKQLANEVSSFLARRLNAQAITFYRSLDAETLEEYSHFAKVASKEPPKLITFGEGLVGQAAQDRELISMQGVSADYLTIASSLGEAPSTDLVILPLTHGNQTQGVLEIASLQPFAEHQLDFLRGLVDVLGIAISSLNAQTRTRGLLEATQQQRQQLQRANAELSQKSEDLTLANKYKSEFLANMSHELRTPLNSFLLLSEELAQNRTGNLNQNQLSDLRVIHQGGKELLQLINDIMDLSKVEAGKLMLAEEGVPPSMTRESVLRTFTPLATKQGLDFEVTLADDLPASVLTDPQRLEQILKNFLSNAFKFTKSGFVKVHIQAVKRGAQNAAIDLPADDCIAYSVEDSGQGIDPENQEHIFEAFHQADGSISREHGGTGLGLTISRKLADLLGGKITLSSAVGQGSTFTLYLPNREPDPEDDPMKDPLLANYFAKQAELKISSQDEPTASVSLEGRRVLLVDDDPRNLMAMTKILQSRGLQVVQCGHAEAGLQQLGEDDQIELVYMDIMMPGMDGYEAIRKIRKEGPRHKIPIIALTAKAMPEDREQCFKAGADDYITKPVDSKLLESAMKKLLARRAAPSAKKA